MMPGETYVDGARISTNPYGATIVLLETIPPALAQQEGATTPVAVLRRL
jgi:hypothetical protein